MIISPYLSLVLLICSPSDRLGIGDPTDEAKELKDALRPRAEGGGAGGTEGGL